MVTCHKDAIFSQVDESDLSYLRLLVARGHWEGSCQWCGIQIGRLHGSNRDTYSDCSSRLLEVGAVEAATGVWARNYYGRTDRHWAVLSSRYCFAGSRRELGSIGRSSFLWSFSRPICVDNSTRSRAFQSTMAWAGKDCNSNLYKTSRADSVWDGAGRQ